MQQVRCGVPCAPAFFKLMPVRRYKAHRELVQIASQLALTAAAVGLLTQPLASTLQGGAAGSVAWFARCVFAEMLGSHAIMFLVRPAVLRWHQRMVFARPRNVGGGALSNGGRCRGCCVRVERFRGVTAPTVLPERCSMLMGG